MKIIILLLITLNFLYSDTDKTMIHKNNGEVKTYYKNGNLKAIISYKDNLKDGNYTLYYLSGNYYLKGTFLKDKAHGVFNSYYQDGSIREKSKYFNGKLLNQIRYFSNGRIMSVINNNYINKQKHQHNTSYYNNKNNTKFSETEFIDMKQLSAIYYHENGTIELDVKFRNDKAYEGYYQDDTGNKTILTKAHLHNQIWNDLTWFHIMNIREGSGKVTHEEDMAFRSISNELLEF